MNRKHSLYLLEFARRSDKLKLNCSYALHFQIHMREACSTHNTVENSHEIMVGQTEGKVNLKGRTACEAHPFKWYSNNIPYIRKCSSNFTETYCLSFAKVKVRLPLSTPWRGSSSFNITHRSLLTAGRNPGTHWIGGWVVPRAGVNVLVKRTISPAGDSNL
jgi:hypothetical protein